MIPKCADCGLSYDDFGLDATLPHDQWAMIAKRETILCANCMVKRAAELLGIIAVRMRLDFGEDVTP